MQCDSHQISKPWSSSSSASGNQVEAGTIQVPMEISQMKQVSMKNLLPEMVEKILSNLDLPSLQNARQVNKLWRLEGKKVLFKNWFIALPPDFHSSKLKNKEEVKEQFEQFLSSNSFTIPHLSIHQIEDLAVLKSLGVLTEGVQSLRWTLNNGDDGADEKSSNLLNKLLYSLPNLNYLDMERNPNICPGLEKIVMDFCTALKNEKIKDDQKPLVLSQFHLFVDTDEADLDLNLGLMTDQLERFSECEGVRIQDFEVDLKIPDRHSLRFIRMINNILGRNHQHLCALDLDLDFNGVQTYLSQISFPEMPNLSKLSLACGAGGGQHDYAFLPSFNFQEVTPKLKEFCLTLKNPNQHQLPVDFWTKFFKFSGEAPSVQKLSYYDGYAALNIDHLLRTFPNLEDFWAYEIGNFESMATSVWKFGSKIQNLGFQSSLTHHPTNFFSFDRIFTGFSQETIERIKNSKGPIVSNIEEFRVNPSVLNLKELRYLFVKLSGELGQDGLDFSSEILPIYIGVEYAFKLMPNVKICIRVNGDHYSHALYHVLKTVDELENVTVHNLWNCGRINYYRFGFPN